MTNRHIEGEKMMDFKRVKENIIQAIEKAGIPAPDKILIDGEIHRFSTNDRPSDKAGWYVFLAIIIL